MSVKNGVYKSFAVRLLLKEYIGDDNEFSQLQLLNKWSYDFAIAQC